MLPPQDEAASGFTACHFFGSFFHDGKNEQDK